jgi:hypothetical protein
MSKLILSMGENFVQYMNFSWLKWYYGLLLFKGHVCVMIFHCRYSTLSQFLLHVKRVQLQLHQCWALQMHRKHLAGRLRVGTQGRSSEVTNAPIWGLRNHMAFLLDNLQYYLQVWIEQNIFLEKNLFRGKYM